MVKDGWPVIAEDFKQWVVEGNFCNGMPAWDKVRDDTISSSASVETRWHGSKAYKHRLSTHLLALTLTLTLIFLYTLYASCCCSNLAFFHELGLTLSIQRSLTAEHGVSD